MLVLLLKISCLAVSGCGFHFHKDDVQLNAAYPTIYLAPSGSNSLYQSVYRALEANHVKVINCLPDGSVPKLIIVSESLTQEPFVYGPDSELRREHLNMVNLFSFSNGQTKEFALSAERDRQLNNKQHLGDNAEKVIILQEMQNDIIQQLLYRLKNMGG